MLTAVAAASTTGIAVLVPAVHFAYRQPGLHIALESVAGVVSLVAAFLVLGRFHLSGRLDALVLCQGLLLIAVCNLFLGALPQALRVGSEPGAIRFSSWAALCGRLIGDLLIAGSAFVPAREVRRDRRSWQFLALGGTAALFAAIVAVTLNLSDSLPKPVSALPGMAIRPRLEAEPAVLVAQLVTLTAFAIGAVGFVRRSRRFGDPILRYLAVATTLGAFARLNYLMYPSLYSSWVYFGDIFRLLSYITLLVGAFHQIARYWQETAALSERRRIARDVHDGVAQELAYVVREAKRLGLPRELLAAAERGLDESRQAIAMLRRPIEESFDELLHHATEDLAARFRSSISIDVPHGLRLPAQVSHTLAKITREAVANATGHGNARHVRITVMNGRGLRLTVEDDGVGFDTSRLSKRGFGLITMRERAESVGARLAVRSAPGLGSAVEVVLE